MKPSHVRVSLDVPRELHRRVHEEAARMGCSSNELMLAGIEQVVNGHRAERPRKRLQLDPPLIRPAGRRIDPSNNHIHDIIEFR
jgi:hypothetical protein